DAAELLARRIEDPQAAGAAAKDVAGAIDLHAVGNPALAAAEIGEYLVGLLRQQAVRLQLEHADVAAPRIVCVEEVLVGGERKAAGVDVGGGQKTHGAEGAGGAQTHPKGQVPRLRGGARGRMQQ